MVRDRVRGDHIYALRAGYAHHGIDCGDGKVVAYTGGLSSSSGSSGGIEQTSFLVFSKGFPVYVRKYSDKVMREYPPDSVVQRALSRVGEKEYNVLSNNCEHFATWCKCGNHRCDQVKISFHYKSTV